MVVLARRIRDITARVDKYLSVSDGGLPDPGTPIPEFSATSVDGVPVSKDDLSGANRVFAMLSTDCAACHDQLPALRDLGPTQSSQPIVVVVGAPERRSAMVSALAGNTIVVEEPDDGPIADAFEIQEFPAVLVAGNGVVRASGHGLSDVLVSAGQPART